MYHLLCAIPDSPGIEKILPLILQIIQTFAVIIGIILVIPQIRQQTNAIKLQSDNFQFTTYMQMMSNSGNLTELLLTDKDLSTFYDETDLLQKIPDSYEKLDLIQRKQYLYLGKILSSMEESYKLWSHKWMDDIDFRASLIQYREIINLKKFSAWWDALKPYYRSDFVSFIEFCRSLPPEEFIEKAIEGPIH